MNLFIKQLISTATLMICAATIPSTSYAQKPTVTIGYQPIVVPMKFIVGSKELEKATGYKINWKLYPTGPDIADAIKNNEIQIGEIGSSTFTSRVSKNEPLELFWIGDDIAHAEALVARNGTNINDIRDLSGKVVATPELSTTHFQLFALLAEERLNPKAEVKLMTPEQIAKAWENEEIDAAFIWNPVLSEIKKNGKVILDANDASEKGYQTFDVMVVHNEWGPQNADFMAAFVRAMARANQHFYQNKEGWSSRSPEVHQAATAVQSSPDKILSAMSAYRYMSPQEQLSTEGLGNKALKALTYASIFESLMIPGNKTLRDYRSHVNTSYIRQAFALDDQ